jgi:hypothetical protein
VKTKFLLSLGVGILMTSACVFAEDEIVFHHYSLVNFGLSDGAKGSKLLSSYGDNDTIVKKIGCTRDVCSLEIITSSAVGYGLVSVVVGLDATHNCQIELIDGYRFYYPNYYNIPNCQGGFRVEGPIIGDPVSGYTVQITTEKKRR